LALDLRYLKEALLIAEHGSFRRAAAVLNVSQSTLTRRVQFLEARLGLPLFERTRAGARLTLAGERFMREATIGASHLRQAYDHVTHLRRGVVGQIRIGLMGSFSQGLLSDILSAFHRAFPGVDVHLEEASAQSNAAAVLNGRIDLAFIPGTPSLPGCHTEYVWDDQVYVALPTDHRLAARQQVAWDSIRDETFLVTADGSGPELEDYLIRQLSHPGYHPRISPQRVSRENLLSLVAKRFGITLTCYTALGIGYPEIEFRPIGPPVEIVASSIVWSAKNTNPVLPRMLEIVRRISVKGARRADAIVRIGKGAS
jgi:DNA-binding transcriptional LysR family regulator